MADPNDLTIAARWEWPAPPASSVTVRFPAQSPEAVRAALDDARALPPLRYRMVSIPMIDDTTKHAR